MYVSLAYHAHAMFLPVYDTRYLPIFVNSTQIPQKTTVHIVKAIRTYWSHMQSRHSDAWNSNMPATAGKKIKD